jgi:glycosyltransferase involved in cell wall biosynthesis
MAYNFKIMKKILFYSDAERTGGHELISINIIKEFSKKNEVYIICSEKNTELISILRDIMNISIITIPFYSKRFQGIRSFFEFKNVKILKNILDEISPVIVISLQGNIELGSRLLLMKYRFKQNFILISYIPLTLNFSELATNYISRFLLSLKDKLNNFYYKIPDKYVVINNKSINELKARGILNVCKIENGIDFYVSSRKEQNLYVKPKERFSIAIIGRVDFKHKGQNKILDLLDKYSHSIPEIDFLIIGEGKDLKRFKKAITSKVYSKQLFFLGWLDQKTYYDLLPEIDMVLMPSNYEGLPLVLLESFYHKKNVIASRIPGIMEYLEKKNTFEGDDINELYNCILVNKISSDSLINRNYNLVLKQYSINRFLLDWVNYIEVIQ